MKLGRAKKILSLGILSLALLPNANSFAESCSPCGEMITNLPLPSYDTCGVAPFQNYIATATPCLGTAAGRSGIYIGTGVGFGEVDYDLNIKNSPDLLADHDNRSYMLEYLTLGYGYRSCFYIGAELGYYHSSVGKPFFYEDDSTVVVSSGEAAVLKTVTVSPCTARIDLSSENRVALDVMPGFNLGCFTVFGRLGAEFGNYSWNRRICLPDVVMLVDFIPPVVGAPLGLVANGRELSDKESDTIGALRAGVGVSFAVSRYLSFQLNYIHISTGEAEFVPNRDLILNAAPTIVDLLPDDVDIEATITTLLAKQSIKASRNEILFGIQFTF
jgi:opacity protein-like surface antigen